MKYQKTFFLVSLISALFPFTTFSQPIKYDDLEIYNTNRANPFYGYEKIDESGRNRLLKSNITTEGSPFNNIDNPQIDSVLIVKLNSGADDEIIKYYYTYDTVGNVAIETKTNYWKRSITYDSNEDIINELWEFWKNNQWVNDTYETHLYDSTGNIIFYINQRWIDSSWVNIYRVEYYYNSNWEMSSYLSEDWNGSGWINSFRVTYTYDSNSVMISRLNQNWGGNDWNGYTWRDTYTYDLDGNLIVHLSEDLINDQWVKVLQWRYEYDQNNNNILTFYDYWEDDKWKDDYKWTQDFDNNGNVIWYLEEVYDSSHWTNSIQTFSTYNSEGYFIFANSERWIESDSIWVPGNEGIFIYDIDGNRRRYFGTEIKVYYHDESNDVITDKYHSYNFFLSQNYPNPFNPTTTIKYSVIDRYQRGSVSVKLKIYDLLGEEIATLVNAKQRAGIYEIKFDASFLSSGIYIYRLSCGDFIKSKKMILLK